MRSRTFLILAALSLLLARPIQAQTIANGTITAQDSGACATSTGCFIVTVPTSAGAVTLQVAGTFSGTLTIEGTADGTNYTTVTATKLSDGSTVTSITAADQYVIANGGLQIVRLRAGSFSSGTATITATRGLVISRLLNPAFNTNTANTFCLSATTKDSYLAEIGANNIGFYSGATNCASGTLRGDYNGTRWNFAVPLYAADGSSSAPSVASATTPTSGMYFPAAGAIAFTTNFEKMLIDGAGIHVGAQPILFGSSVSADDSTLSRTTANTLALRNGSNAQTFLIGPTTNYLSLTNADIITAPTQAAGGTVNTYGDVSGITKYQITISPAAGDCATAFIAGATTADCTIGTLQAGMQVMAVYADVTTPFTCSSTCSGTKTMTFGKTAGGAEYLVSFSVTGTVTKGLADADLGTSINRANAIQGGDLPSWSATTALIARFTSGTGFWGTGSATNVNAGTVKFTLFLRQVK